MKQYRLKAELNEQRIIKQQPQPKDNTAIVETVLNQRITALNRVVETQSRQLRRLEAELAEIRSYMQKAR
jgi:hypothetical protein